MYIEIKKQDTGIKFENKMSDRTYILMVQQFGFIKKAILSHTEYCVFA